MVPTTVSDSNANLYLLYLPDLVNNIRCNLMRHILVSRGDLVNCSVRRIECKYI